MKDWNGVKIRPGQRILYKINDTWHIRVVEDVTPQGKIRVSGPDFNVDPAAPSAAASIDPSTDAVPNRFLLVIREVDGSASVPGYLIRREQYPAPLGWIPP